MGSQPFLRVRGWSGLGTYWSQNNRELCVLSVVGSLGLLCAGNGGPCFFHAWLWVTDVSFSFHSREPDDLGCLCPAVQSCS